MQVTLTVLGGVHDGRSITVRGPEFHIGRDPSCHLRPASTDVSRKHCAIVVRAGRVFLRDYGSSNGTLLNERLLLQGELQLENGDIVRVGPLAFRIGFTSEPAVDNVTQSSSPPAAPEAHGQDAFFLGVPDQEEPSPHETSLDL